MHELLLIVSECLAVPHIFNSRLPSSFNDEVDIFTLELVLCGFIVCLDTEGPMVTSVRRTTSTPYTKKKGVSLVAQLGEVQ
jgi:hypothetical protein